MTQKYFTEDKSALRSPGPGAQLLRASSWYAKVMGSIPGQGIYKNPHIMNV